MRNFRSFGNLPTEIDFLRNHTTLITGANGTGKTSILYAVQFGLFGKVTDINKPALLNDVNNGDCLVEIEFSSNGKDVLVRRGMKPNIFDIIIDGNTVDQTGSSIDYQRWLEDTVIGCNLANFSKIVSIQGFGYVPFFMLKAQERRSLVDSLLDITVFPRMQAANSFKINNLKEQIAQTESEIEKYATSIISLRKGLAQLESKDAEMRAMIQEEITSLENKFIESRQAIQNLVEQLDARYTIDSVSLGKLNTKLKQLNEIDRDVKKKRNESIQFIKFVNENDVCPTCNNVFSSEYRTNASSRAKSDIEKIDEKSTALQDVIEKTELEIQRLNDINDARREHEILIKHRRLELQHIEESLTKAQAKLSDVNKQSDSILRDDIIKTTALLEEAKKKRAELLSEKQYHDLVALMLKDSGIKSKVIKQIIPRFNEALRENLSKMQFHSSLVVDENFIETVYRRHSTSSNYTSFSAGERARIDIAVLFAWRTVAKEKNSLNCNLLFLDEIFDNNLDDVGIDLFVEFLESLPDTNVFWISHRPEVIERVEHNIKMVKRGNFSVLT
jgi:DNA repair exonuclease SbcCD ATPase subunit